LVDKNLFSNFVAAAGTPLYSSYPRTSLNHGGHENKNPETIVHSFDRQNSR